MDIYDELLDAQQPDTQPAQGGDAYDAILDDYQAKQTRQLEVNLDRALQILPEKAATAQQLAKSTGLPEELVERNFDQVQKQVRVRELQSVLAASPILARQMADPQFAKLAQDDLENLSLIERLPRQFAGGGIETIGRTLSGIGELGDVAQRNIIGGLASILLPEPAHGDRPTAESLTGPMIGEGWRGAGDLVKDFAREDVMIPGAQQTFTDQVAAGVGQVGAQILLHYLTGGVAGTATMYAQGADIMADRVEGDDAPQWRKDVAILGGAAITGLTEKWALDRILGPLAVPVKNQVGAALARIGIAGVSEGGQEFVENIMHEVLRQQLTNPDAEISIAGAFEEAEVGAAVGVIVRSIVESALHVRVRHQHLEQQANEAEVNAAQIEQLNQLAAANKMLQLSPESFEQFVEAAAEEGPVQGIFIDANTLMQSGVAEQIAAVSPTVAEQLRDAVASGGMINIPVAEYAARIAPTEYAQSLLDHLKTDPNGFSRAEAREYMQSQAEVLEAEVAERIANVEEQDAFRQSQEQVKQTVLAELNALGRFTEQKNELDATLIAARTAVRAAQLGTTPEALFERQRLRFAAERLDGDQFDQGALQQFGILESDLSLPVDELIARNEETPVNSMEPGVAQDLPLGSIRVAPYGGDMDERYVDVLTEVPVDSLLIAEPEDNIRSTPEYQQYVQWALEGREAPLIQVNQNERGEYVAANRRRALVAREAGIPTLRAWVSPINPATGDPLKYGDLRGQRYNQTAQDQQYTAPQDAETGKAMRVYFARNTESSKNFAPPPGMDFGQDIEPAGEYMVIQDSDMADDSAGWEFGTITFRNPLVLEHKNTGSTGWKKDLSDMFDGKTGRALSNAVKKAGYDGIVTLDENGYYSEAVNLAGQKGQPQQYNQSGPQQTASELARQLREEFPGLKLDLMGRGNRATLSRIVVPEDGREQGTGTQVMQRIAQWADTNGVTLALTPSSDFGGSKKRLTEFYKRFGFVENKGRNKDYEISEAMYRPAQQYNQSAQAYVASVDEIQGSEEATALAEELLDNGAQITPDGRVRVFHRTSVQSAATIRATGQMTAREDGLFFSTRADGQAEGFGDTVVEMHVPLDQLQLDDVFGDEAHVRVPLQRAGQRLNVAEWLGAFNQNQRAPRGAFNPDTNTIALLKNADLSTFLHEAGHYFFESDITLASELVQEANIFGEQVLTEGERQILTDVSALLRWHGIQGPIEEQLNTWHNMPFEEKRVAHERTAESFEAYLFEGNAPSIELQPYFQRFREFLKRVYTDLKNFLARHPEAGQLNDEVRAVFDRMLATDEQIELAQQARSMFPLFRTEAEAENIGMTPEEFAAYQAQDPQATADAVQDLQARGLRDLQWTRNARNREIRKLRRQSAALRREVRMEVRAEVMSQPVYRAWQFLTGKITPEDRITPRERPKSDPDVVDPTQDSLLTAIAKLGGLNKQAAIDEWGMDPAERPNSGVFGKPVLRAGDQGLTIDGMREALSELGYLPADTRDGGNPREFEERFDAALRGEPVYSNMVDAEVLVDPVPGTGANPENLMAGRLDLGALAEMDVKQEVVDALKARRMTAADGIHPDLLPGLFGFSSSEQMLRELVEATPPNEEIEARTDARMLEQHGELATPEAIEAEADKAIHNEARARMIATEANALARAVGQRRVLAQAAKAFAQTMVARVKIRDIRPSQYANAEARAGKAAEKASRAGDLVQAAAEKRTQLVNNYATRAAYDAREEVDKGLRYLNKFNSEGSRKGLDVEYLEQIDTLLERFDLRRGQSLRAIDKRTNLAQWIANQEQAGLEPDLPDYILAEANRTHYKNLTVEEFRGLVESVRQIEHLGRLKKKLLTAKDQRELDAIVEEMRERIEQSSGGRTVDNERRNTTRSWMNHMFRGALAAHRKAASVVREMDGFEEGGPVWERIIRPMNERGEWEVTMRAEAAERLHELAKPVLALGPMGGQGDYFATLGRSLNRGERIAIALNYGNDSNRQRLLSGRNWTDAQIQPVLSSLTATEWRFVQGVWEFFESYRPEIAAKERRVYGKEPDWIEPSPFTVQTADGQTLEIAGGYYPIKYDPRQSGKAGEFAEAEEAKAMMRAAYTAATTRRSFTKSRAEEVHGRPLLLTFDGIWQGANEVIHDLAWHEWLIDVNRLMRRIDSAVRTHYGAEYVDVLRNTIKDVARGDIPAANQIEAALTHVRNGSSIVGMGWNLFTALLQPLGIANSIVRVGNGSNRDGAKWIGKGMSQFYGSPRHMLDKVREVQAMSEFMANRSRTMNREIADVRNRLETGRSDFQMKLEGTYFLLIQRFQELVDYPTWLGAYEKAVADPRNLNEDGTINEARAVALADQAVIDSQSAGTIKDLSQVQRGHPAMKLFTNFYSYFNVLLNLAVEQGKIRVQRKDYAGLMSDYLILIVAPAVLSAVMREALRGQDDEDEYLKAVASELVGYPFGMFVLGRELAGAAQLAAGVGNPAFGYSGPAGLRFFAEINKLGQQAGQGDLDMALFKAANNVGGILFHYPASQINRAVDGTAALIEGRTENPLAPLVGPPPR